MNRTTEIRRTGIARWRWVFVCLCVAACAVLAMACRGGDSDATPPPATIIRATGEVPATATPGEFETPAMPPTVPPLPTAAGGTDPYPLPTGAAPAVTSSPIAYPSE